MMKKIIKVIKALIVKYQFSKYDNFTICEYFRKQGAQIGDDCHIGIRNLASEPYLVKIGNKVGISNGVLFITHTSGWNYRDSVPDLHLFGKIEVGDNCYIGANSILLPNICIGNNCIVAAGSIVTKDIPENVIVAGVPAKIIGSTDDYFFKIKAIWDSQKPEGYMSELIKGRVYSRKEIDSIKQSTKNTILLRKSLIQHFWGEEK